MFAGGLLFGYGMVLSNGCGSRALVLLGRGNLRSFVVVIVLGIAAQMTLKGLIAPARIAVLQATQAAPKSVSLPALLSTLGLTETFARMIAASRDRGRADHLCVRACAVPARLGPDRRRASPSACWSPAAGLRPAISAPTISIPPPVTSLTFIAPIADTVQYAMLSTGLTPEFRHRHGGRRLRRKPGDGARHRAASTGKALPRRATCCARSAARR